MDRNRSRDRKKPSLHVMLVRGGDGLVAMITAGGRWLEGSCPGSWLQPNAHIMCFVARLPEHETHSLMSVFYPSATFFTRLPSNNLLHTAFSIILLALRLRLKLTLSTPRDSTQLPLPTQPLGFYHHTTVHSCVPIGSPLSF